ncbi:hypothetical protein NIA69_02040 [Gemmiger formicilis]|nr:hypothetical protein [Gemmiger formicilis]
MLVRRFGCRQLFTIQRLDYSNVHIQASMLPQGSFSNKQQLVDANQGAEHYEKNFGTEMQQGMTALCVRMQ